jgi:hypothetical protein
MVLGSQTKAVVPMPDESAQKRKMWGTAVRRSGLHGTSPYLVTQTEGGNR